MILQVIDITCEAWHCLFAGRINALKDMGFSLASCFQKYSKSYENPQALKEYLLLKQTEIQEQAGGNPSTFTAH